MSRYLPNKRAFTIVELVIVIVVVLILAAVAVSQSSSTMEVLRFNSAFNKVIYMVQKARSLAVSGSQSNTIAKYSVGFQGNIINIKETPNVGNASDVDPPEVMTDIISEVKAEDAVLCTSAEISFKNATAKVEFSCGGWLIGSDPPKSLTVTLCQVVGSVDCASALRKRSFKIHAAAGIPQID